MKTLDLETAISLFPLVWVVGEPLLVGDAAIRELTKLSNRRVAVGETGFVPVVWNASNGLVRQPVQVGEVDTYFLPKSKPFRDAEADLLDGLLQFPGLVIYTDNITFGPSVVAAAMKVVEDDMRRVIFVSSTEPPSGFLADYLKVVDFDFDYTEDQVRAVYRQNDGNERITHKENLEYKPEVVEMLRGLRPFTASSVLMESFLLADKGKVVPYVYNARAEAIFRDTAGVVRLEEPTTGYADLIGLDRGKAVLTKLASKLNTDAVRGVMLLGVPGTGKTALSRAVAGETQKPLYIVDIGATQDKFVGESQRHGRMAIRVLMKSAPGIVLFNEVDKYLSASKTGAASGDSGTAAQTNTYFLEYFENPKANGGNHLILATSNDALSLPPEWTRAGRWDVIFWFGMPPVESLEGVFELYRNKYNLPKSFKHGKLDNMTPAEVEAVCRIAHVLDTKSWDEASECVPRIAKFRQADLEAMEAWAEGRVVSVDSNVRLGVKKEGELKLKGRIGRVQ